MANHAAIPLSRYAIARGNAIPRLVSAMHTTPAAMAMLPSTPVENTPVRDGGCNCVADAERTCDDASTAARTRRKTMGGRCAGRSNLVSLQNDLCRMGKVVEEHRFLFPGERLMLDDAVL